MLIIFVVLRRHEDWATAICIWFSQTERINNILKEKELNKDSVIKEYLTTASDGKKYKVVFYSLEDMRELLELEKELKRR